MFYSDGCFSVDSVMLLVYYSTVFPALWQQNTDIQTLLIKLKVMEIIRFQYFWTNTTGSWFPAFLTVICQRWSPEKAHLLGPVLQLHTHTFFMVCSLDLDVTVRLETFHTDQQLLHYSSFAFNPIIPLTLFLQPPFFLCIMVNFSLSLYSHWFLSHSLLITSSISLHVAPNLYSGVLFLYNLFQGLTLVLC